MRLAPKCWPLISLLALAPLACDKEEGGEDSSDASSASASDASDDTSASDLTGDGNCEPSRPEDECSICLADTCCPELLACAVDDDCACALICLSSGGDLNTCIFNECPGVQDMPLLSNLNYCASVECSGICPQGAWQP